MSPFVFTFKIKKILQTNLAYQWSNYISINDGCSAIFYLIITVYFLVNLAFCSFILFIFVSTAEQYLYYLAYYDSCNNGNSAIFIYLTPIWDAII